MGGGRCRQKHAFVLQTAIVASYILTDRNTSYTFLCYRYRYSLSVRVFQKYKTRICLLAIPSAMTRISKRENSLNSSCNRNTGIQKFYKEVKVPSIIIDSTLNR